jgi:hypothetical protein
MPAPHRPHHLLATFVAIAIAATPAVFARAADTIESSGIAMIPHDAVFVSSTLRLREQWQRFETSNAFAALRKLPAVSRAIDSLEDQKLQPGSPLSMIATFMELPENVQALEVLDDMVSTDTFVYGDPSCLAFMKLVKKINQAQNAAGMLRLASGAGTVGGFDIDVLDGIDMEEDDDDDEDEDEKNKGAARGGRIPVRAVKLQAAEADEQIDADEIATRLIVKALNENLDLIVVPDIVWGFKTTKLDAGRSQLKRLEVLVKLLTQANPALAESLQRRKVAGGEVVTFTVRVDPDLLRQAQVGLEDYEQDLEKVLEKVGSLELVIALGIIDDRVILSIGDSIDHLEKLAVKGGDRRGLLATKPFEPLLAHKDKRITAVSYLSDEMARLVAPSAADIEELAELSDEIADLADLPDGAAEEARASLAKVIQGYRKRLPVPGPWMAYSFLSDQGYEGYVWDWCKNLPYDGSKRLDLLEHAGGAPLAALMFRAKNDPAQFDDFVSWGGMARSFFMKYLLPKADEDDREKFEEIDEHLLPVAKKAIDVVRAKILPALADGQIGFVLDSKSATKRLHKGLPSSAEPLPLVEPAIVLGLDDPKLFREGMSDLFQLGDELVDAVRELNPDAVPAHYRVPEPAKTKVEGGTLWSFGVSGTGFDEKIQPSLAVGDDAAVLTLVPKQAGRLLVETRLETASQLSKFEEPLVGAAALDVAGLVDALQPWIVYLARFGSVQQRQGGVDADTELGPDDEDPLVTDALSQGRVVFEVLKSLRVAAAETATQTDATVTHWRNVIRDLPAK